MQIAKYKIPFSSLSSFYLVPHFHTKLVIVLLTLHRTRIGFRRLMCCIEFIRKEIPVVTSVPSPVAMDIVKLFVIRPQQDTPIVGLYLLFVGHYPVANPIMSIRIIIAGHFP